MHLQTMRGADPYKVWLETRGAWSIEKCGTVPAKIFNGLRKKLEGEPQVAGRVRAEWVHHMMVKGWLGLRVSGHDAVVTAYPGAPHAFERCIDLRKHARPALYAEGPQDVILDDETAALVIGARFPEHARVLVNLADVLWQSLSPHSQAPP